MEIEELLEKYGKAKITPTSWNQWNSVPVEYELSVKNAEIYNEIYQALKASDLNIIVRTKSGGISNSKKNIKNCYAWDHVETKTGARITVIMGTKIWVFKIGAFSKRTESNRIPPWKAWNIFTTELAKDGFDIDDYKISPEEGETVKKTIPKPLICMNVLSTKDDKPLEHVHHIDFHSSYPAGLANYMPKWRPTIERLYKGRDDHPEYKAALNLSIGAMQSPKGTWKCQWAHLAKEAIKDNNNRIAMVTMYIKLRGWKIIGYNTDGIWYQTPSSDEYLHGKQLGMGPELGQFSHDYFDCKFRAKSNGAYEFEGTEIKKGKPNGTVFKAVLRGTTKYDMLVPRESWTWGDIYRDSAEIIMWHWDEDLGIVMGEENDE